MISKLPVSDILETLGRMDVGKMEKLRWIPIFSTFYVDNIDVQLEYEKRIILMRKEKLIH